MAWDGIHYEADPGFFKLTLKLLILADFQVMLDPG